MLKTKIQAILFVANKPLSAKQIWTFLKKEDDANIKVEDVFAALTTIAAELNYEQSGVHLLTNGEDFQLVSNPNFGALVKKFLKQDLTGELTPAGLETLSVIAYRGPVSKIDIEEIRGVNCGLILRNLMIRGLVEASSDELPVYRATTDFVKFLGINSLEQLPDFERLHNMSIGNAPINN
ncbi:SMC-Scp complex subunit ScpB [Candidatus Falkowbacteria bacterium]|nr:SMC-Scp complex subunit ScpB [Candidatus Falkowbacteria bacterium]